MYKVLSRKRYIYLHGLVVLRLHRHLPPLATLTQTLSGGGIAIPGTTKINRLEENVGSLNVHLTAEEVAEIGALISPEEVIGDRYPTASMGMQYR